MAEYLMYDKDKAAFINRMNKMLNQVGPGLELDSTNFIDIPGSGDSEDQCIFVADSDIKEKLLDAMIDKRAFSYTIKKINLKEMVDASRK
jgi:hypothetical protein